MQDHQNDLTGGTMGKKICLLKRTLKVQTSRIQKLVCSMTYKK